MKCSPISEYSDEDLMLNFKSSDNNQYFELLVSRYKNKLYRVTFNLLGDASEAEEIVQEAFIRVWRGSHSFRHDATFAGWIFTITQNLCKDMWRLRRRKSNYQVKFCHALSLQENEELFVGYKKELEQIGNCDSEPARKAENAELRDHIDLCLDQLPNNQRVVIILRDIEGHSYKQIAQFTGVSIGTVRSRLHYGRQKLKQLMK